MCLCDWAALTADLDKDEIDALVKSNPQLKRRLDGELGSRLQAKEQAIREEARIQALAEYNAEVELVNAAIDRYDAIEALQETDPDKYDAEWRNNTQYRKWVADLFAKRDEVAAKAKVKPSPPPSDQVATQVLAGFHNAAIPEAIDTIRTEAGDLYLALPAETRKAIENVTYNPDSSWLQDILANFVKGAKAASEQSIKRAVAAAREAARAEFLAESNEDRPVTPSVPNSPKLTAAQIIQEHAFNGFRNITPEQLRAAKREKGLNY